MSYYVDPDSLFPIGSQIRANAQKLNNSAVEASETLEKMHETWDGKRWNILQNLWNELQASLNGICEYLVSDAPTTMETISENYANGDARSVGTPLRAAATGVAKISLGSLNIKLSDADATEEKKLRDVLDVKFDEIINDLNAIEANFNDTIPHWQGPAATEARNKFEDTKAKILSSISNMRTSVTTCIDDAINDLKTVEEQNKSSSKKAF